MGNAEDRRLVTPGIHPILKPSFAVGSSRIHFEEIHRSDRKRSRMCMNRDIVGLC